MGLNIQDILSGTFTNALKGISDIVHSWVSTKKDQQIAETDAVELNAKIEAMMAEIQQKAVDAANAADAADQANVTDRWKADMASDNVLSKNARPIVLLYSWFLFTVIIVMAFFKIQLPDAYIPLVISMLTLVTGAYFGSRAWEKITTINTNKK